MSTEAVLLGAIEAELAAHGFVVAPTPVVPGAEIVRVWTRKTWNTNRAAVVLRGSESTALGPVSQQLKLPLGKAVGYFPFFYGIGLQLIWVGEGLPVTKDGLVQHVDKIDNQRSIIQSLFAVDLRTRTTESARTWGQVVTGKFQDAIDRGIRTALTAATTGG